MRRPLRRFVLVLVWLVAIVPPIAAVGYLLYANLLDSRATQRITGAYDGYYWDAAQLQIAYARLENQLLQYRFGANRDYAKLQLRYAVLQSKLRVLAGSTRNLASQPDLQRRQQAELATLDALVAQIDPQIAALETEPDVAGQVFAALHSHWNDVNELALSRRFADVEDREAMSRDFLAKRRMLFAAGVGLLLLSAAATVLLVFNGFRRTRLINQQKALLAAEHDASRAAREASLAKDAFLGMISHELRTPLHAIVSSIELLGLTPHSEADGKVIRRLEIAARQLETQMKDLTDYARLGAGKLELRDEEFDPRELLASIADQHEAAASAKGLVFDCAVRAERGGEGRVVSDPHRIRQIANNLVTNAIRYTERGSVRLEFVMLPDVLSIVVRDTGPGVPQAQIPQIFKEFTQLDASRSRRFEGAGMGLAIVKGLVDLFGGTIETDSRLGQGTTFTVTVPVRSVPGTPAAHAATDARNAAPPQVLVVDDNPLVRESLCEMVAHMGYSAHAAADVDEALAWLDSQRCDVVLLDLHMPGRDGYSLMADLDVRAGTGAYPGGLPRVIAVSAYMSDLESPDVGTGGEPFSARFFDSLTKPVHYDVLRAALQRALAAGRSRPGLARAQR
ncbi:ATP-binding protein [Paraburkholderia kururiensis]|uniref:histidine kinase n=1 Tax=Paraburkholderia kururiensis TaxID=984307 RepID=A0ABZ0WUW4_9BURK|nr:ATP-binding protein [Paraburkholderia kururiensis]WQD81185.1 ATP-binding protein [Paraburkholderia kururiensis]